MMMGSRSTWLAKAGCKLIHLALLLGLMSLSVRGQAPTDLPALPAVEDESTSAKTPLMAPAQGASATAATPSAEATTPGPGRYASLEEARNELWMSFAAQDYSHVISLADRIHQQFPDETITNFYRKAASDRLSERQLNTKRRRPYKGLELEPLALNKPTTASTSQPGAKIAAAPTSSSAAVKSPAQAAATPTTRTSPPARQVAAPATPRPLSQTPPATPGTASSLAKITSIGKNISLQYIIVGVIVTVIGLTVLLIVFLRRRSIRREDEEPLAEAHTRTPASSGTVFPRRSPGATAESHTLAAEDDDDLGFYPHSEPPSELSSFQLETEPEALAAGTNGDLPHPSIPTEEVFAQSVPPAIPPMDLLDEDTLDARSVAPPSPTAPPSHDFDSEQFQTSLLIDQIEQGEDTQDLLTLDEFDSKPFDYAGTPATPAPPASPAVKPQPVEPRQPERDTTDLPELSLDNIEELDQFTPISFTDFSNVSEAPQQDQPTPLAPASPNPALAPAMVEDLIDLPNSEPEVAGTVRPHSPSLDEIKLNETIEPVMPGAAEITLSSLERHAGDVTQTQAPEELPEELRETTDFPAFNEADSFQTIHPDETLTVSLDPEQRKLHPDDTIAYEAPEPDRPTPGADTQPENKKSEGVKDEGSGDLFDREYRQGLADFDQANWPGAVHHLSIAAALRPEVREVKDKLREARRKRKSAFENH